MSVMSGAEPFQHTGGSVGVLLCHGFTGSPQPLRPWARYLAEAGLTVSLPLLPGHGTTWQDMARTGWRDWYGALDRALEDLRTHCTESYVMGLSLGGCLALRLAQQHPDVRGLVLVNPSLFADNRLLHVAGPLGRLIPSVPGITDDINKPGVHELGYSRIPVRAAAGLPELYRITRRDLPRLTQPMLVFHSARDHVVGPRSLKSLRARISSELTVCTCEDSHHVATLDNDAEMIFEGSLDFVRRWTRLERG